MKKLFLIVVSSVAAVMPVCAEPSTIKERLGAVLRHSGLGSIAGASAVCAGWLGLMASKAQTDGMINERTIMATIGRPLGTVAHKILQAPQTPLVLIGLSAGFGIATVYHGYELVENIVCLVGDIF